jgi:hypothetical protein
MPNVSIPEQELPVLRQIAEFEAAFFDSLITALGSTEATLTAKQLSARVSKKLTGVTPKELFPVLNTISALFYIKDRANVSAEEIGNSVSEKVLEQFKERKEVFPPEQVELLRKRLTALLELDQPLGITAKAVDVMTESHSVFCGARILSDIRPIFTKEPDKATAAVLIHNLQIGFHDGGTGRHQEFYVSMDTQDIETLKQAILRAEEKTKALKSILEASKLTYLEV